MPSLKETIQQLPKSPGVYRYFDKQDNLIYVGKAKNLKNRVSSYFQSPERLNQKTRRLVSQIVRIEYTVVDSEYDALFLENSLIKQNQPKYNILLKDDKTYPYLCILKERFPRIIVTRRVDRKAGEYFGPYTNSRTINTLTELFKQLFTLRTCTFNLAQDSIDKGKFKVCLEYHIGNCLGPCENLQTEEDYMGQIEQARNILKGKLGPAKQFLEEKMLSHAQNLEFEKAENIKKKLLALENYQGKSVVSNPKFGEMDVCTITSDEDRAYINFLKVQHGCITLSKNLEVRKRLEESDEETLGFALLSIREDIHSQAKELLTNLEIEEWDDSLTFNYPKIGDKRKLVELSFKNALSYRKDKRSQSEKPRPNKTLEQMQKDLRLKDLPKHIECFDNSNIQGTNPVSSMVCFRDGKPAKKDYRHYKVKTVEGPNDFDTMKEVVYRRYKRLVEENSPLPDLVIIDGGKGQLGAAMKIMDELGIRDKLTVIGIAKRLEEIFFPGDKYPLLLSKKSPTLRLIQQLRDEAHRFAITFHRDQRSKHFIKTGLEDIEGIGPKTIEKLLRHFRTVKRIQEASVEEVAELIGKDKAERVKAALPIEQ